MLWAPRCCCTFPRPCVKVCSSPVAQRLEKQASVPCLSPSPPRHYFLPSSSVLTADDARAATTDTNSLGLPKPYTISAFGVNNLYLDLFYCTHMFESFYHSTTASSASDQTVIGAGYISRCHSVLKSSKEYHSLLHGRADIT